MEKNGRLPDQTRKTAKATPLRPASVPQTKSLSALAVCQKVLKFTLGFMDQALFPWREVTGWLATGLESDAVHSLVPVRSFYRRDY